MQARFAGFQIDLLTGSLNHPDLQIDHAVLAKRSDYRAGMGIEFEQPISCAYEDDPIIAAAIGPIGHASTRQLAGSNGGAIPFAETEGPVDLAGSAVQGDHGTARAARSVQGSIDRQRCAFQLVFWSRPEVISLKAPRYFQLVEVRGIDLIEGHILAALQVGGVVRPIAFGG